MTKRSYTDLRLYRRLLAQARDYWPHITGIFLLRLLSTPLALLTPVPLKIAVDNVVNAHPLPAVLSAALPGTGPHSVTVVLAVAAGLLVAIAVLSQIQGTASSLLFTYTGEKLIREFRVHLFGHVQRLSVSYHDAKGTSEATYRIQYDVEAIQSIVMKSFPSLITAVCTLGFMFYITLLLDWQLAVVALVIFPLLLALSHVSRGSLRRRAKEVKQLESSALSVIQEVLGALRVVKAFGQEDREKERFARISGEGLRARLQLAMAEGVLGVLIGLVTAGGTAAALYLGVRHVLAGVLTLGELLVVLAYLAQLYSPLKTISKQMASLQSSLASAERAYELLDRAPDVVERPHAQPLVRTTGAIELRDVSFAYDGKHLVLRDVSLDIPAGTRVGIAGRTGAGKTTLLLLLSRFHDPTTGQILLDGVDLRDYKLNDLRKQFAIVLQDPVLFSASIAENVSYALPGADFDQIVVAAKAANAHEFIIALPNGYDTMVGERGMRLSGGERQRIALARAFLKDAPILLLDEPTSSVDVKTETAIMEAMERLMEGRTTFLVTHRHSTLEVCNVRIELQHGCALSGVDV